MNLEEVYQSIVKAFPLLDRKILRGAIESAGKNKLHAKVYKTMKKSEVLKSTCSVRRFSDEVMLIAYDLATIDEEYENKIFSALYTNTGKKTYYYSTDDKWFEIKFNPLEKKFTFVSVQADEPLAHLQGIAIVTDISKMSSLKANLASEIVIDLQVEFYK